MTRPSSDSRDTGTTLIELMVAVAVMAVASVMIGTVLVSAQRVTNRMQSSASAIDDARLISATLDRELRSAVCIHSPGENLSGNTLRFQTNAYGDTVDISYVVAAGTVTRSVIGGSSGGGTDTVIDDAGATSTAFKQVTTPLRTVVVDIPIKSTNGGEFHLLTTVAGRNAWRRC